MNSLYKANKWFLNSQKHLNSTGEWDIGLYWYETPSIINNVRAEEETATLSPKQHISVISSISLNFFDWGSSNFTQKFIPFLLSGYAKYTK